jgi:hypothetical protein
MLMTPALFEELKKRWKSELGPLYIAGRSVIFKNVSCNWVLNEATTFKSSSILIYSNMELNIYTKIMWHDAIIPS